MIRAFFRISLEYLLGLFMLAFSASVFNDVDCLWDVFQHTPFIRAQGPDLAPINASCTNKNAIRVGNNHLDSTLYFSRIDAFLLFYKFIYVIYSRVEKKSC